MKKRIKSTLLKLQIRWKQKQYKNIRYLLQTNRKSDTLVVCFSGFGNGGSARYNYISTLTKIKANKLFILDDFGYNKQGSYYLGENGNWFLPDMIVGLIEKVQKERDIHHIVMVGSSKGGTASLYYAIQLQADACIIGAPQYFIGDYLSIDRHLPILQGIMGDTTEESIHKLNCLMRDCVISAQKRKPKVYIHYSPMEHTYSEHIVDMLADLKQNGFETEEDANYTYTDHAEVAKYFPTYLCSRLEKMITEDRSEG